MAIRLLFTNRNIGEDGLRIYRSSSPFDQDSLPAVYDTIAPGSEVYLDEAVSRGEEFYYMVEAYRGTERVYSELLHAYGLPTETGPGPQVLMLGDHKQGFYGEVPASEFITGSDLAGEMGLTAGTVINDDAPWLKFNLDGKTLFYPKLGHRHTISWDQINTVNLVYGDRTIMINNETYKVRLMKGLNPDPKPWEDKRVSGNNPPYSYNSEWNRLNYLIIRDDVYIPDSLRNPNAPYTNNEIGHGSGGAFVWCQERNPVITTSFLLRGGINGITSMASDNRALFDMNWRAVLELVN